MRVALLSPTAKSTTPFDLASGGLSGWGLRRLRAAYAGKALNIRRSSDNATQDIGFTAAGDFDAASFSAFIGGGNGFATKLYDQNGANDLSQATAANQPQIILNQANGRPILRFNGTSSQIFTSTFGPTSEQKITGFLVYTAQGSQASGRVIAASTTGLDFTGGFESDIGGTPWHPATDSFNGGGQAWGSALTLGSFHQITFWDVWNGVSTGSQGIAVDRGTPVTGTTAASANMGTTCVNIGAAVNGGAPSNSGFAQIDVGEILLFASDLSASGSRQPVEANQKSYWGTP